MFILHVIIQKLYHIEINPTSWLSESHNQENIRLLGVVCLYFGSVTYNYVFLARGLKMFIF